MKKNILSYLEETTLNFPSKIIFADNIREITYENFLKEAKMVGTSLLENNIENNPIVIFIDKTVNCLSSMFGIVYSGNFYVIIDTQMPIDRINLILNTLDAKIMITDKKNYDKAVSINNNLKLYVFEEMLKSIDDEKLLKVREKMIDTDPLYVLFTSGSTGNPKGTVITHKSVIAYANWYKETFDINENTIFGSQTPFYFSMSVSDIYSTIISGATFYIIPKMFFSFPVKLIEFLNEKKINTIYWVPSALSIVANLKTFDTIKPLYLKKVLFAGEVMPVKQLNVWIKALPNALFANLFGPTELTDICTYYIVDREFDDCNTLPIGKNCDNCGIMIIKDDNTQAKDGEEGELCVRGSFLASGYYNNLEKTSAVFTQNPLNKCYPELIYRTGDIVKYNEHGELIYLSRKDFQIKHMGYRIELGEIETNINSLEGIISCACIYRDNKIVLFYQSEKLTDEDVLKFAKLKLPQYMCPNKIIKLKQMPHNANGKIDRNLLKNYEEEI